MGLQTCPECRGSVSSAAASCPHCGHPMGAPAARLAVPAAVVAEHDLWQGRPSAKALLGAIVGVILFSGIVCVGVYLAYQPLLGFLAGLSPDLRRQILRHQDDLSLTAVALVMALIGWRLVRLTWRLVVLKSTRYRITNQRMVIESGVLSRRIDEIDMRTVEDLDFQQSVVERLLGIGDITVISSDRTNARTRLVGLAQPRQLRELLRQSAYQATHSQLFTRQT
jgi:membrane protein YdbS with pleckstrin-like domain